MTLDQFFQVVGLQDLTQCFCRDDSLGRLKEKTDRLTRDLRQRYPLLVRHRGVIEGLRHRLTENQRREAMLAARVETYLHVGDQVNAWRHALELDQTRKALEQDKVQLQNHEQAYQDHLTDVEQLKRRLAALREKVVVKERWLA